MPTIWFRHGALYMTVRYVQWRDGLAFFRRRIPRDLERFYPGRKKLLFFSLKTRDPNEAAKRAHAEAKRLDAEWSRLREGQGSTAEVRSSALAILQRNGIAAGQWREHGKQGLEPEGFIAELEYQAGVDGDTVLAIDRDQLPPDYALAADLYYADAPEMRKLLIPTLSEVSVKHLEFKGALASDDQFHRALDRFIAVNGDLPMDQYRRSHGHEFIRELLDSGLKAATVKRYLAQIRPVFETAILELEIGMANPLSKLRIPKPANDDEEARSPFSLAQIRKIQARCREVDDPRRWLILMLSDTGCRLAEVAGLMCDEVDLNSDTPHIIVKPNKIRRLKTPASRRLVPLVGEALWAARRASEGNVTGYLFPSMIRDGTLNNASLSAALNAWLKRNNLRNEDQPLHSLRHSLRDRMRNAGVPTDVQDRIGGWATTGVGESYGSGHELVLLHRHMIAAIVGTVR